MKTKVNKPAYIVGQTNSFFKKGDDGFIKEYDSSDDTYLFWRNGGGIWIKKDLFKFQEK